MIEDLLRARSEAERFVREARVEIARRLEFELSVECIVSGRVKSEAAITEKALRRRQEDSNAKQRINDYIGIRVVTATLPALAIALAVVDRWAEETGLCEEVRRSSLFSPPPGGYRVINIDYSLENPGLWNLPPSATVEIQLTSYLFHLHAVLTRHYFHKRPESVRARIEPLIGQLSTFLYELDQLSPDVAAKLAQQTSPEKAPE